MTYTPINKGQFSLETAERIKSFEQNRGFGVEEFKLVGEYIGDVLDALGENLDDNSKKEKEVLSKVQELCAKFPIYDNFI